MTMRTTTPHKPTLRRQLLIARSPPGSGPGIWLCRRQEPRDCSTARTSPAGASRPAPGRVAKGVSLDPANPEKLRDRPGQGVLVNSASGHTVDLMTEAEFGDVQAHVEFCITKHSNSGVYLMGRYEVQVYDSFGVEKDKYPGIECGGIYPRWINEQERRGPLPARQRQQAARRNGRRFDITFRAPRFDASGKKIANAQVVKVVHNGKVIHENVELNGPTRGAMSQDEKPTGPSAAPGRPRPGGLPESAGQGDRVEVGRRAGERFMLHCDQSCCRTLADIMQDDSLKLSRREMLRPFGPGGCLAGARWQTCAPLFAAPDKRRFRLGACDWSIGKMGDPAAFEVAKQIGLDGVHGEPGHRGERHASAPAGRCSSNTKTPRSRPACRSPRWPSAS